MCVSVYLRKASLIDAVRTTRTFIDPLLTCGNASLELGWCCKFSKLYSYRKTVSTGPLSSPSSVGLRRVYSPIHTADATKLFCRVGVGGVYMNSRRLPTDSAMRSANAQRCRRPWSSLQYCSQWVTTADGCVHTADATWLDSFVSSASAVCIGHKAIRIVEVNYCYRYRQLIKNIHNLHMCAELILGLQIMTIDRLVVYELFLLLVDKIWVHF